MVSEREVINYIKHLLLVRLELEDKGLRLEQVPDDQLLLDESGLGLHSLEILDLLVGLEQRYGPLVDEVDYRFMESICYSVRSLADFVVHQLSPVLPSVQMRVEELSPLGVVPNA